MEFWNEPEIGSLPLPPSNAHRYKSVVDSGTLAQKKLLFFLSKGTKEGGG